MPESTTTERTLSAVENLLDPAWAERYVDVLVRLGAASKEFGPGAFSQVLELETERIRLESAARIAERKAESDLHIAKMQREHDLWKERWKARPWLNMEGREWLIAIIAISIVTIAIFKEWLS